MWAFKSRGGRCKISRLKETWRWWIGLWHRLLWRFHRCTLISTLIKLYSYIAFCMSIKKKKKSRERRKTEVLERCGRRGSSRGVMQKLRCWTCEDLTLTFEDGRSGWRTKEYGKSLEAEKDPLPSSSSKEIGTSIQQQHGAEFCQHHEWSWKRSHSQSHHKWGRPCSHLGYGFVALLLTP